MLPKAKLKLQTASMALLTVMLPAASSHAFAVTPETFATAAGTVRITPIMHASLLIQAGGKVLYVDPSMGKYDGMPPADYILITDIHQDHLAPAVIDKLKKPGTVILAPRAVAGQLPGSAVIANGETRILGAFTVEAVPMYNLTPDANGKYWHDKGRGNGYVLTYGGKRFYFSGDTDSTPEMKALRHIDVAFVCMNLPYTMPPERAAEGVKAFHPAIVYPYHYQGNPPTDLNVFVKALQDTGIDVRLRDWYPKD